jgi:hypothetical protein
MAVRFGPGFERVGEGANAVDCAALGSVLGDSTAHALILMGIRGGRGR